LKSKRNGSSLALKTKIGFGICDIGGNLFFTTLSFHLTIFLTDTLGLAAGLMGFAMMIGRIVDAFSDPLMGYISDHTRSRWGRRRPYIFFGSIPLVFFFILMFTKPDWINSQTGLFIWVTLIYFLMTTSYTIVNIPYGALTPDLTRDYNQQTVLNGYRMSFAVVGTLVAAGAAIPIIGIFGTKTAGYTGMGIIFGLIMLITAWITFFTVKEPEVKKESYNKGLVKEYILVLSDKTFLKILIPWGLYISGVTVVASTLIYFFQYVYRDEGMTTLIMLALLVTALAFIPVWVKISKKIGKKSSYITGMGIFIIAVLLVAFTADKVPVPFLMGYMVLAGIGLSTHYVMPYSLIPDVVENNYAETGKRREGIYYGLWTFLSKLGQAISALIIGIVLTLVHYIPGAEQTAPAEMGIRMLVGPVPVILIILGMVVMSRYPITSNKYKEILKKIYNIENQDA
jgi:GPH family glycoside/pentoside/hexuronide:cation symporter